MFKEAKNWVDNSDAVAYNGDETQSSYIQKNELNTMGVRKVLTISDDALKNDFVLEKNNDALSKGTISDGLSARFRREHAGGGHGNRRQKHREELSTYKEQSSNNESGVPDGDGDRGG